MDMKDRDDLHNLAAAGDLSALVEAMGHSQPFMRFAASDLLAAQGENALPHLLQALTHDNPDVRKGAARALGIIGDRKAIKPLLSRLEKEAPGVSQFIVDALAGIGDIQVVDGLCEGKSSHRISMW
jgi:HEAT repeat protein